MPSLRKRGKSYYVDYRYHGKRFRRVVGTDRYTAQLAFHDIIVKIEREQLDFPVDRKVTVAEFIERYLEWSETVKAPTTVAVQTGQLSRFLRFLNEHGVVHLTGLNSPLLERYKIERAHEVSKATVNQEIAVVKAMVRKAVEWHDVSTNPLKEKVAPFKTTSRRLRFLSEAEVVRILDAAPEPLRSYVVLLLETGLRRKEVLHLEWRDIDLSGRVLHIVSKGDIQPKGFRPHAVPLSDRAMGLLERFSRSDGLVFSQPNGRPLLSHSALSSRFKRFTMSLGLQDVSLHTLRHTFASHLIMRGVPMKTVGELLGHASISSTEIYTHLSQEHLRAAVEKLPF